MINTKKLLLNLIMAKKNELICEDEFILIKNKKQNSYFCLFTASMILLISTRFTVSKGNC